MNVFPYLFRGVVCQSTGDHGKPESCRLLQLRGWYETSFAMTTSLMLTCEC